MKPGVIAIIVVVLAIVGLGFFQYQQVQNNASQSGSSLSALSTSFSASLNQQDADVSQVESLLSLLNRTEALSSLDETFFQSKNFKILRDFYITLRNPENVGRPNPFLGINEGGQQISPSTQPLPVIPTQEVILNELAPTTDDSEPVFGDAGSNFIINPPASDTSGAEAQSFDCDFENDDTCFDQLNNSNLN